MIYVSSLNPPGVEGTLTLSSLQFGDKQKAAVVLVQQVLVT